MNFKEFKAKHEHKLVEFYPHQVEDQPLVSVCVMTYQHVSFIEQCLEGILMQETDFAFEILLGDDASTDGTREICIKYAEKYPDKIRLFLHHRENNIAIGGSPTGRFNFVYNLYSAKGKYIALCEGDDYWTDSTKLQKQVDYLQSNTQLSMLFHPVYFITANNKKVVGKFDGTHKSAKDFILKGNMPTCSLVFSRDVIDNLPHWFSEIPGGDFGLGLLALVKGEIGFQDFIGGVYNTHEGGIFSSLTKIKSLEHRIEANKFALGRFNGMFDSYLSESIVRRHLNIYVEKRRIRQKGALKHLADSLRYSKGRLYFTIRLIFVKVLNVDIK